MLFSSGSYLFSSFATSRGYVTVTAPGRRGWHIRAWGNTSAVMWGCVTAPAKRRSLSDASSVLTAKDRVSKGCGKGGDREWPLLERVGSQGRERIQIHLGVSTQGREGSSSPLVLAGSCSRLTQTSRQATCPSSWTLARCRWRSSASTCPTIPASGSSHETACA